MESHTKLVYKYIKQDVEAENNHTAKGRVEQMGTPTEIYKNPKTPFVAQFIGESAVIADYDRLKGFHPVSYTHLQSMVHCSCLTSLSI